jgi:pyridoxal kinase
MPNVLVLSSHVASSRVGGKVATTILEHAGVDTVFCPTANYGRHPGLGAPGGAAVADEAFANMLEGVEQNGCFESADAVLTGYFASPGQVEIAAAAIRRIREAGGKPIIAVDPAIGGDGRLSASDSVARAIRKHLVPLASFVAPNAFELGWLTGHEVTDADSARRAVQKLGKPALVSSIPAGDEIGVMYEDSGEMRLRTHPRFDKAPRGAGDMLAAEFLLNRVAGAPIDVALHHAVLMVYDAILKSREWDYAQLPLPQQKSGRIHPDAAIAGGMRRHHRVGKSPCWVLGLDGCRGGWIGVWYDIHGHASPRHQVFARLDQILLEPDRPDVIAIDMPIGFPERAQPGGRQCEREARTRLKGKTSSVFSAPSREALGAGSYEEACRINAKEGGPGLSRQSFSLFPKMREVDAFMASSLGPAIHETHPETAFAVLNRGPILERKRTAEGRAARLTALRKMDFPVSVIDPHAYPNTQVAPDDLVDAAICAVVAQRIANGQHLTLPENPPYDARGLKMAIHA